MSPSEKLLRELVARPSVNPAFLPPGDSRAGEGAVAGFLQAAAAAAGLDTQWQPVAPGRSNLLVRLAPSGRARGRVILAPHLDTVGEESMPPSMFDPVRAGGRLYGRGACDTKGSVAAMFSALLALAAEGPRPARTEIVFAGLVDEERSQAGSRVLARSGLRADLAVIGEPTRLEVITAHKGVVWLVLETRGRAAHGSRPDLGRNAILEMNRVLGCLAGDYAAALARRTHPLLGSPTLNIGSIQGGAQPNIVPSRCAIEIDRRTLPGETAAGVAREIKSLLREHGAVAAIRFVGEGLCPPLETDARNPRVQDLMRAAGQTEPAGAVFFSDASILAAAGVPSVLFGPGDIAQAHTAREWISIRSLDRSAGQLRRFLQSLP